MEEAASERDVLRASAAMTASARQVMMQLACIVCRETLSVSTVANKSQELVDGAASSDVSIDALAHDGTDRMPDGAGDDSSSSKDPPSRSGVSTVLVHDDMARCSDCDGLFHRPCLQTEQNQLATTAAPPLGARASVFTCAQCSNNNDVAASAPLPLLVPVPALPYLAPGGGQSALRIRRSNSDASDCSDDADWFRATPRVEACLRCHQLDIAARDRVVCSACGDAVVHVRCCLSPALVGSALLQDANAVARKRKRPHVTKPRSSDAVCGACAVVFDPSVRETAGRIGMRVVSAAQATGSDDASASWRRRCSQCRHSFCVDALASDAPHGWTCMHCTSATAGTTAAPAPSTSLVLSCPSCQQPVDSTRGNGQCAACTIAPLADAPPAPHELVTLLICDGCEGEFDFAQLAPPLTSVPDGDWFCDHCALTTPLATGGGAVDGDNGPFIDVTLLICDGCEGEFDMSALVPPLTSVPDGDWFCDPCAAARSAKTKAKSRAKGASRRAKRPGKASAVSLPLSEVAVAADAPLVLDELVTMLICDGCDGEFDAALLQPPLAAIPIGDWFCTACDAARSAASSSRRRGSKAATSSRSTLVDETGAAAVVGHETMAMDVQDGDLVDQSDAPGVRSTNSKKRKRSGIGYAAKRRGKSAKRSDDAEATELADGDSIDPRVSGINIPQPVALSSRAAASDDKSSSNSVMTAALVLSDDDASDQDDNAEDAVVIVCDMCLAEFNLIDAVGASASAATPPPRPWYCIACVKSLKRTRKKRQRFSKQMLLEMQIYGELLRPTAAKAYDTMAAALRGKPPRTPSELTAMFRLVGKRVGIYFKWDKHWVMARVLSFHAQDASFHHVVRFDDGVEKALPLYAFPLVIGTRTMVFVKVPTLENAWWPAQVLRRNPMATKLLTPDAENGDVSNFRLVSIFASSDCQGKTQNVASWVPKYLCRSMAAFSPLASTNGDVPVLENGDVAAASVGSDDRAQSIARALDEARREDEVRHVAFQRLVKDVCAQTDDDDGDRRVRELADALVGRAFIDSRHCGSNFTASSPDTAQRTSFSAIAFNSTTLELELTNGDEQVRLDLVSVSQRFFLATASALADVATQFANCATIAEAASREQTETRAALATDASTAHSCALCLLPTPGTGADDAVTDTEDDEELVACTKCARRFHRACCDPPCDAIPLLKRDDGTVLLDDVHAPYVCSECVSCAGCGCRDAAAPDDAPPQTPQWSQWRLPLQVAALCRTCVPFYDAKQFCAVCLLVLSDDDLATCVSLHACSTCELWVHAACEPDPHPAFLAHSSAAEFDLDVHLERPPLPVVAEATSDDAIVKDDSVATGGGSESVNESVADAPTKAPSTTGDAETETSKPARLVDEEFAFGLRFKDAYDPKVLHKYECLTCRKLRMLHVIHRLRLEDKLELFKEPVTKTIAPTYFDVIKEPMDLSTMERKVLANAYTRVNFRHFRDDFELLCLNAVTFNSKERDFLIWREAWRFYGQGQRIFRQTAPKSRMKHRGGKYHDALVTAAKRQLPNNSQIGKKQQLHDGSDAGGDDDFGGSADGDHDDELEALEDRADAADEAAKLDVSASTGDGADKATTVAATASAARDSDARATTSESGAAASALPGIAATPLLNGTSAPNAFGATGAAADRKLVVAAPSTALVLQSELGEPTLPLSATPVFKMVQARLTAHTYAWMDMCLSCGSAGLSSEMVFCVDCGEGFHAFCVPNYDAARIAAHEHLQAFWRCANCKMCEGCGRPGAASGPNALHFCGHCDSGFHGACLLPAIKPPSGDDDDDVDDEHVGPHDNAATIFCASCVTCDECGKAQQDMTYSYDQRMCLSCSQTKQFEATLKLEKSKPLVQIWTADARKQKKDSEKCPLCKLRWDPEDEELIQCDACELWAHPQCDSLLSAEPERYRRLVDDPSALYICEVCRPMERAHLANVPNSWKCQVLIGAIQAKREQIDAKWKEARAQLEQAKQWKFWRDHTPVYLYVLRLGEECLKTLACRSVNFRANWTRFSREQELRASGVALPEWLVHKASRYMRFKRYSRGPRAALRRQERKTSSFYSRTGVERQKDASVIATIVSEACSAAALLACVHLLYGWRPLPQVVLHLLSTEATREQGHERLSDATLRLLTQEHVAMSLEDEIAMIQTQYERRVGKKPVASREATDTSGGAGPIESGDSAGQRASPVKAPAATAAITADAAEPAAEEAIRDATAATDREPSTQSVRPDEATASDAAPLVKMTQVPALCGWPSPPTDVIGAAPSTSGNGATDEQQTALVAAPAPEARAKFTDNRFCSFCFMIGDDAICGRLIYTDKDQWVHVNCALWSVEVYETADGVLQKCQKAKNRSRLIRCDACGVLGASIGCAVSRCPRHYHFPCAYDYGVVFLPNGETCCPKPEHIAMMSRKQKLVAAAPAAADAVEAPVTAVASASESASADVVEVESSSPPSTAEQEIAATIKDNDVAEAEGEDASHPSAPQATESSTANGNNEDKETKSAQNESATDAEATETNKAAEAPAPTSDVMVPPTGSSDTPADASSSSSVAPAPAPAAPVLPVVDPAPEPRRHLRSDLPVPLSDIKKLGAKSRRQKRVPCIRVGALTVQSFGHVVVGNPSFHCRDAIFPLGYRSTRIFWSARTRQTRALYECVVTSTEIEERLKLAKQHKRKREALDTRERARAVFKIVASDDREHPIVAFSPDAAVLELRTRIAALYEDSLCFGTVMADKNPFVTRSSWFSYGLTGAHFFGVGIPDVVNELEQLPHAATTSISRQRIVLAARRSSAKARRFGASAALSGDEVAEVDEQPYVFTQHLPTPQQFDDALREVEQLVAAEERARLSSGSTRTDGFEWQQPSGDGDTPRSAPIRRRLNKHASRETPETLASSSAMTAASASNSSGSGANAAATGTANNAASGSSASANAASGSGGSGANAKSSSSGVAMDLEHLPIAMQYRELRRRPFDERLEVRKSKIHGYGLFTKEKMAEGQMIVEYQGQMIAQDVADEREKWYEEKGIGSCYMFRLDDKTIIDATRVGNLARFINHSCDPKAFARVVTVEGNEKKIVIFAKRAIDAGDEVTYDYKFPIEDEAIRCDCSAPNCIGRMN